MINNAILTGTIGASPMEIKNDEEETVLSFNLSTKSISTILGIEKERIDWHRISILKENAKDIKHILKKGVKILVRGNLQNNVYVKNEKKVYRYEVFTNSIKKVSND